MMEDGEPVPMSSTGQWTSFAEMHPFLRPPLRPSEGDITNFGLAIRSSESNVLLLGVTPELTRFGRELTAADLSPRMIKDVWPGDSDRQRALLADWTRLPFENASFSAVIGDGSLSAAGDNVPALLREIRRVLRPDGVAAFRTFCAPGNPETLHDIRTDVRSGWQGNFHALKFRIAMALAGESANWSAPVQDIRAAFNASFPDREELAKLAGYSEREISTIDFYEHADHSLVFTPLEKLVDETSRIFREVQIMPAHSYPLCERCPLLVGS